MVASFRLPQHFNIDFNNGETVFIQRPAERVYKTKLADAFVFPRDDLVHLDACWVFHGLDNGDVVEMDTFIYDGVYPLVLRGPHKEAKVEFDAWKYYAIDRTLSHDPLIVVGCGVTGVHLNTDRWTARAHWGIYLLWRRVQP